MPGKKKHVKATPKKKTKKTVKCGKKPAEAKLMIEPPAQLL